MTVPRTRWLRTAHAAGALALCAIACGPEERNTQVEDAASMDGFDGTPVDRITVTPPRRTPSDGGTTSAPPVMRGAEDCTTPFDDDDDGRVNEDCPCEPGRTEECFQRPEDLFEGMCRMGTHRCEQSGEGPGGGAWGECTRAWLPLRDHDDACQIAQRSLASQALSNTVDVIWFVDSSPSMREEIEYVNRNLEGFALSLTRRGIDYRVVMIAARGTGEFEVCVPPPLGGAGCADAARFRHVNQPVNSTNGLVSIITSRSRWADFVRPGARKFFVAVTDDDSEITAANFTTVARAWPGFEGFSFFSIVGYESERDCPTIARRGTQYLALSDASGGARARVCDSDWSAIFDDFAGAIATPNVRWVLDERARPDTVQLWRVSPPSSATRIVGGWTYNPTRNEVTVARSLVPPPPAWLEARYRPADASP